jgi:hypothetical protein
MSNEQPRRSGRLSLLLIAAAAIAPLMAAYALYFLWQPSAFTNYGELLTPAIPIADVAGGTADGRAFTLNELHGRWVFLTVDSGACEQACRDKLYKMRQVRLTQGKDMERVERAWLIDDAVRPSPELAAQHEGARIVSAQGSALLSRLPADGTVRRYIYIVDPLGNVMMRYRQDADPSRMKKDLSRLLRVSRIG